MPGVCKVGEKKGVKMPLGTIWGEEERGERKDISEIVGIKWSGRGNVKSFEIVSWQQ